MGCEFFLLCVCVGRSLLSRSDMKICTFSLLYRQNYEKRANSVRLYLIDQGIDPGRIIAIGYGEEKPVIQCKTEEACSEEEHELNRRCEFVIKRIY